MQKWCTIGRKWCKSSAKLLQNGHKMAKLTFSIQATLLDTRWSKLRIDLTTTLHNTNKATIMCSCVEIENDIINVSAHQAMRLPQIPHMAGMLTWQSGWPPTWRQRGEDHGSGKLSASGVSPVPAERWNTNLSLKALSVSPSEIWYSLWDNSEWGHCHLEPLGLGLGEALEEAGSVHGDRLHLLLPLTQSSHLLVFDTTTRVWNNPTLWFNKSGSSSVWSLGQVIRVLISSRRPLLRYFGRACLLGRVRRPSVWYRLDCCEP